MTSTAKDGLLAALHDARSRWVHTFLMEPVVILLSILGQSFIPCIMPCCIVSCVPCRYLVQQCLFSQLQDMLNQDQAHSSSSTTAGQGMDDDTTQMLKQQPKLPAEAIASLAQHMQAAYLIQQLQLPAAATHEPGFSMFKAAHVGLDAAQGAGRAGAPAVLLVCGSVNDTPGQQNSLNCLQCFAQWVHGSEALLCAHVMGCVCMSGHDRIPSTPCCILTMVGCGHPALCLSCGAASEASCDSYMHVICCCPAGLRTTCPADKGTVDQLGSKLHLMGVTAQHLRQQFLPSRKAAQVRTGPLPQASKAPACPLARQDGACKGTMPCLAAWC